MEMQNIPYISLIYRIKETFRHFSNEVLLFYAARKNYPNLLLPLAQGTWWKSIEIDWKTTQWTIFYKISRIYWSVAAFRHGLREMIVLHSS